MDTDKELYRLYVKLMQEAFLKFFNGKYRLEDVIKELYSLFAKSFLKLNGISVAGILVPEKNDVVSLRFARGYTRMANKIERQVIDAIKERLVNVDVEQKNAIRRIFEDVMLSEKQKSYVKTWVHTLEASASQAQFIKTSLESGIKYYKYVGPPPERGFCKQHYGKTYTIDEIVSLSNGQGLDPLLFCGGYNCRHRWVASTYEEYAKTNKFGL